MGCGQSTNFSGEEKVNEPSSKSDLEQKISTGQSLNSNPQQQQEGGDQDQSQPKQSFDDLPKEEDQDFKPEMAEEQGQKEKEQEMEKGNSNSSLEGTLKLPGKKKKKKKGQNTLKGDSNDEHDKKRQFMTMRQKREQTLRNTLAKNRNRVSKDKNNKDQTGEIISYYKVGDKIGQYGEDYMIINKQPAIQNKKREVYYKIKPLKDMIFSDDLETREIHFIEMKEYEKAVYNLISYQNNLQNFQGDTESNTKARLEQFQKVFNFWSEFFNQEYLLIIVQESLPSLQNKIDEILGQDLDFVQDKMIPRLLYSICDNIQNVRNSEFEFFVDLSLENCLWREKSRYKSSLVETEQIAVVTYKSEDFFTATEIMQADVQEYVRKKNFTINVFHQLIDYMKSKNSKIGEHERDLTKFFENELAHCQKEISPLLQPDENLKIFKISQPGEQYDCVIRYESIFSDKYPNTRLVINEIHCFDQQQHDLTLMTLTKYQELFQGLETWQQLQFTQIYEFWSANEEEKKTIYVVIKQLNQHPSHKRWTLEDILIMDKEETYPRFNEVNRLLYYMIDFCFNCNQFSKQAGYNVENLNFLKQGSNTSTKAVFSYKYKNHFSEEDLKDPKTKSLADFQNHVLSHVINLVSFVENKWMEQIFYMKPETKSFNPKEEYKPIKELGEGSFGKVHLVEDKNGNEYALKSLVMDSFAEISDLQIETTYGLLFDDRNAPLLQTYFMFLTKLENEKFQLNILMEKGEIDLFKMTLNQAKPLGFKEFYPIFRDTILGICYMHQKTIAHRDIKPQNILKLSSNKYLIADYGEGINLNYQDKYLEKVDFMVDNDEGWGAAGTPCYMDPLILKEVQIENEDGIYMVKGLDLFKADIFALGLTLLFTASAEGVKHMNSGQKVQEVIYSRVHKLNLPIQIKQTMLSMTKYENDSRIPTVSLFQNLRDIMHQLEHYKDILFTRKIISSQNEKGFSHLIRIKSFYKLDQVGGLTEKLDQYKFTQKISKMAEDNQSYYSGHLKIKSKSNQKKRKGKCVVLVKPAYIPGVLLSEKNDKSKVSICGNIETLQDHEVIAVESPVFNQYQYIMYFNEDKNEWQFGRITEVDQKGQTYTVQVDEPSEVKVYQQSLKVKFHSMKLKPILFFDLPKKEQQQDDQLSINNIFEILEEQLQIQDKDPKEEQEEEVQQEKPLEYFDFQVIPDEQKLMTYNTALLNFNQLFERSYELTDQSTQYLVNILNGIQQDQTKNIFRKKYTFRYYNEKKNDDLMLMVLKHKFYPQILIQKSYYSNTQGVFTSDIFGETKHNYSILESFELTRCFIKKSENFDKLFDHLDKAKKMHKAYVGYLKYKSNDCVNVDDLYRFKKIEWIRSSPLTQITIAIDCKDDSNIMVPIKTLTDIFIALSTKNLEKCWIILSPFDAEEPTDEDVESLEKAFNIFCQGFRKFWLFDITLNFIESTKVTFSVFKWIVNFIKEHQQLIDTFHNMDFFFVL